MVCLFAGVGRSFAEDGLRGLSRRRCPSVSFFWRGCGWGRCVWFVVLRCGSAEAEFASLRRRIAGGVGGVVSVEEVSDAIACRCL